MGEMKERGEWNRLLSVLVGLARTADRVPADEETGSLVREGLALLTGPAWERAMAAAGEVKISEAEKSAPELTLAAGVPWGGAEDLAERIRRKKAEILPDCAACRTPCGRFFDYDTDDLWQARPEIRERKIEILREAGRRSRAGTGETDTELLCRALFAVGEFCGAEWLDEILGGLA